VDERFAYKKGKPIAGYHFLIVGGTQFIDVVSILCTHSQNVLSTVVVCAT